MTQRGSQAVRFAVLVALYLLGGVLAVHFIERPDQVTLIWAPAGIGYATLLLWGLRWWPVIAVSVLLIHLLLAPVPAGFIPFSISSNVMGAVAGAWLVRRFARETLSRLSLANGLKLLLGGCALIALSAPIGVYGMIRAQMVPAGGFWSAIATWAMGDMFGLIAVTPAMLMWFAGRGQFSHLPGASYAGWGERAVWSVATLSLIAAIVLAGTRSPAYVLGLASFPIAMLLWSAVRFEPLVTSLATMILTLFVATLVGLGMAGFAAPSTPLENVILLCYMCLIALVPQMLAAAMHENRIAALRLVRRANTDTLTRLPNRQAFDDLVRSLIEAHADEAMALAYLDLDQFKVVNDTASHAAGDDLLVGLSGVLRASLPASDLLARIGGDEFGVLMRDCPPSSAAARAQSLRQVVAAFRLPYEGHVLATTVSVGLVPFRPADAAFGDLLAAADAACFTAKELGGDRVQVASTDEGEVHRRRVAMHWVMRLNTALEHHQFEIYCQSITPLRGEIPQHGRHFEVLLRLRDPDTGELLLPGEFVHAAERFQLAPRMDRYVIDRTLGWLDDHPEAAASVELCSLNVSAAAVTDDEFATFLRSRVSGSRLAARQLCFELTETSAVRELARAQAFIASVRRLGCRFALDDFGTGFCSFQYLRALEVDFFKIDGSFVRDIADDPMALAVVRSIADIGRFMGKATIAECVETETVRTQLIQLGVDYAQGYAIDQPQPIDLYFTTPVPLAKPARPLRVNAI